MKKFVRVLIGSDNKYLIINEDRKSEAWNFPGGKVENYETPMEACKREVFEETNLILGKLTLLTKLVIDEWEGYYYIADDYKGSLVLKENKCKKYSYIPLIHFSKFNHYISLVQNYVQENKLYE